MHLEWRYGRVPCLELGVVHQNARSVCQTSGLGHMTPSLHGFRAQTGRSVGACHPRNHFSRMHQKSTLPAATRGADAASRASRGLAALKQVKCRDLRQASQVSAVRMSIEVLLRHVSVPKHICVLDLLLVAYILLRACDDRNTVTNVVGGQANLPLLEAVWEAANPFYAMEVDCLTFRAAMTALNLHPALKVGNPFWDDPFTEVLRRYWQCTQSLLSIEQSLVNVLFILATHPELTLRSVDAVSELYRVAPQAGTVRLGDGVT